MFLNDWLRVIRDLIPMPDDPTELLFGRRYRSTLILLVLIFAILITVGVISDNTTFFAIAIMLMNLLLIYFAFKLLNDTRRLHNWVLLVWVIISFLLITGFWITDGNAYLIISTVCGIIGIVYITFLIVRNKKQRPKLTAFTICIN